MTRLLATVNVKCCCFIAMARYTATSDGNDVKLKGKACLRLFQESNVIPHNKIFSTLFLVNIYEDLRASVKWYSKCCGFSAKFMQIGGLNEPNDLQRQWGERKHETSGVGVRYQPLHHVS